MATTKLTLASATTALVAAGSTVDKAINDTTATCTTYARFVAKGLIAKTFTLDDASDALVAACMIAATPKQRKEIGTIGSLSRNGFPTVYGWFRMLVRISEAGRLADLLNVNGKPSKWTLQTLGRDCKAVQPKAPRKASKGKGKADKAAPETATAPVAAAPITIKAMRTFIVALRKAGATADLMAHEADVSVILAEAGNLARLIEAKKLAAKKAKAKGTVKARKAA
jgi:hypothetical protein